jgi:hypothetical protein
LTEIKHHAAADAGLLSQVVLDCDVAPRAIRVREELGGPRLPSAASIRPAPARMIEPVSAMDWGLSSCRLAK